MDYANVSRPSASIDDRQVGLHTNGANRERLLDADTGGAPIGVPNIPLPGDKGLAVHSLSRAPNRLESLRRLQEGPLLFGTMSKGGLEVFVQETLRNFQPN